MNSQVTTHQLIDRTNVVMFLRRRCAFSDRLRQFISGVTSDFVAVEVDTIPDGARVQREITEKSGVMIFPQLFIKGKFIGGALDAEALSRVGELERLIR